MTLPPPPVPPVPPAEPNACTLTLVPDAIAVRLARRLTECAVECWGLGHAAEPAGLVISELSTNALRKTPGGTIQVRVSSREDGILLAVWDRSDDLPPESPALPGDDEEGGRGLFLVAALSLKHGVQQRSPALGGGKTVWALISGHPERHEEGI